MADEKVYMMNALWFKPEGGRAMYEKYIEAATPYISAVGGRLVDSYVPYRSLIGEFDADQLFFVEYPSWDAFKAFANDEGYQQNALPIREQALANSLLIRCKKPD